MFKIFLRKEKTSHLEYDVYFNMSVDAFKQYLRQTHCNIDYNVELCGYTISSVMQCCQCMANANVTFTSQPHDLNCDLLLSLLPECSDSVNYDVTNNFVNQHCPLLQTHHSPLDEVSTSSVPVPTLIKLQEVTLMFDHALQSAALGNIGVPRDPPPLLQSATHCNESPYAIIPFLNTLDGSMLLHPIDRCSAVKYCTQHGYVLVDTGFDLFQPFHCFMVNVVDCILDCYDACPTSQRIPELEEWKSLNFQGDEGFPRVCLMKGNKSMTVQQYIQFLLKLPHMKLFFQYSFFANNSFALVSFLMSLKSFRSFNNHQHLMTRDGPSSHWSRL